MLFNPSHPGEVLNDSLGDMTVKEAARRLGVTRSNLSRILNGRAGISAAITRKAVIRVLYRRGASHDSRLRCQVRPTERNILEAE